MCKTGGREIPETRHWDPLLLNVCPVLRTGAAGRGMKSRLLYSRSLPLFHLLHDRMALSGTLRSGWSLTTLTRDRQDRSFHQRKQHTDVCMAQVVCQES